MWLVSCWKNHQFKWPRVLLEIRVGGVGLNQRRDRKDLFWPRFVGIIFHSKDLFSHRFVSFVFALSIVTQNKTKQNQEWRVPLLWTFLPLRFFFSTFICSRLNSFHHSRFRFAFRRAFRVSCSRERAVEIQRILRWSPRYSLFNIISQVKYKRDPISRTERLSNSHWENRTKSHWGGGVCQDNEFWNLNVALDGCEKFAANTRSKPCSWTRDLTCTLLTWSKDARICC